MSCPSARSTTVCLTPLVTKSSQSEISIGVFCPLGGNVASTSTNIESLGRISTFWNVRPLIPSTFSLNTCEPSRSPIEEMSRFLEARL